MGSQAEEDGVRGAPIDLALAAADAVGTYANFVLTRTDDHVVRMSVMTEPFFWHRHPGCDETFLVTEGTLRLRTETDDVQLSAGQMYTVEAGVAHITSPVTARSVNITVEKAGMTTEQVAAPQGVDR